MSFRKFVDSPFESHVKPVADAPVVEFDSDRSCQRPSTENLLGYEESKFPCFRAVMVAAKPLKDSLLRDGIISYVVVL